MKPGNCFSGIGPVGIQKVFTTYTHVHWNSLLTVQQHLSEKLSKWKPMVHVMISHRDGKTQKRRQILWRKKWIDMWVESFGRLLIALKKFRRKQNPYSDVVLLFVWRKNTWKVVEKSWVYEIIGSICVLTNFNSTFLPKVRSRGREPGPTDRSWLSAQSCCLSGDFALITAEDHNCRSTKKCSPEWHVVTISLQWNFKI